MLSRVSLRTRALERGSASLETVLITPILIVFLALVIAGGSLALGKQAVTTAAYASARSASLASSPAQARSQAIAAFNASLKSSGRSCSNTKININTAGFSRAIGQKAQVEVTITCTISYTQLTKIPGLPASKTITETVTSPLDPYKELR
ncbi:TadE family protein [Dermabacteraceae bacterium CCM 9520]